MPTHIEVGIAPFALTATVHTRDQASEVTVSLIHSSGSASKSTTIVRHLLRGSGSTVFSGRLAFSAKQVPAWGQQHWVVVAALPMHDYDTEITTDLREHSLLGSGASRSGQAVTVAGTARRLSPSLTAWMAWAGTAVRIQRWSKSGWVTIGTVFTDQHGDFKRTFHIPWRVGIRTMDASTSSIWGQTSATGVH